MVIGHIQRLALTRGAGDEDGGDVPFQKMFELRFDDCKIQRAVGVKRGLGGGHEAMQAGRQHPAISHQRTQRVNDASHLTEEGSPTE